MSSPANVSKQRLSKITQVNVTARPRTRSGDPYVATEWLPRLFQSSYTRDGKRIFLQGWAVKIQHQGRRRTFSLRAKTKSEAAVEAKAIHDTIGTEGWEAALKNHPPRSKKEGNYSKADARHWTQRLLLRRYRFPAAGEKENYLTARIDHAGTGHFFPLGTADGETAAARAQRIYQTVLTQGWDAVGRKHPREVAVAFEWNINPMLWTYTTIHTLVGRTQHFETTPRSPRPSAGRVLIVELDAGVRRALAWCLNQHPGCGGLECDSADAFGETVERHKPQLVILNRKLAEAMEVQTPGQLTLLRQGLPVLTYSVYLDADQLFVSAPGGASSYMLKRLQPGRLLEPLHNAADQPEFSSDDLFPRVKSYFKSLLRIHAGEDSSALAKLTPREREVLALLSRGCVDKEIAQALDISAWTVHGHIKKIFERLQVRTRTEAVVRYLEK